MNFQSPRSRLLARVTGSPADPESRRPGYTSAIGIVLLHPPTTMSVRSSLRGTPDSLQQIYRRHPADAYGMVWAWSGVDKEQTLAWLEKAYSQHSKCGDDSEGGTRVRLVVRRSELSGSDAPRPFGSTTAAYLCRYSNKQESIAMLLLHGDEEEHLDTRQSGDREANGLAVPRCVFRCSVCGKAVGITVDRILANHKSALAEITC